MLKNGYRIIEAQDGNEGLETIDSEGIPDLILVDVAMPIMDGYAFCRAIRKNPVTAAIPVIMMASRDRLADPTRDRAAGINACLTKPFEPADLVRIVGEFCSADGASAAARMD